jgi:tetratricopeptide (TPR) repeat protein
LATLAEERDELELAAEHFEKAWRLLPDRRSVLVDLGRVWKSLNRLDPAYAALLAASRGGEPRAAEAARELLPARYPFVPEFRGALALDPSNTELRRELAYLFLKMERQAEAEEEFKIIVRADQSDLLSAAQLGFLYLARGDRLNAMPLLERVLGGGDEELANRVRAVLRQPQVLRHRGGGPQEASDAKQMAERSMKAGYLKDALKYLQLAQEADPVDFHVMLQLGWTYNLLHDDRMAVRWFTLARRSPDPALAGEAARAYAKLRPGLAQIRTSVWMLPFYSSRWHDVFSYGQARVEYGPRRLLRPYLTARFIGDTRRTLDKTLPLYLSESSVILGLGLSTQAWKGFTAWGEAGSAFQYLTRHVTPDYRTGVSFFRGFGHALGSEEAGWFADTSADALYASRLGKDMIVYTQARYGYTPDLGGFKLQVYANANVTFDARRQDWANFVELGPGVRFRWDPLPPSLTFSVNLLRGAYTRKDSQTPRPTYFDLRAGFGYAFSY